MDTVREIYELAAAIIFERPGSDEDFDLYTPKFLTRLLMEALPYENMIRRQKGQPPLETSPKITQIDDTMIDWDDRITRNALPHGLASCLMGDENSKKAESVMEYNKFVAALDECAPAIMEVADDAETD